MMWPVNCDRCGVYLADTPDSAPRGSIYCIDCSGEIENEQAAERMAADQLPARSSPEKESP